METGAQEARTQITDVVLGPDQSIQGFPAWARRVRIVNPSNTEVARYSWLHGGNPFPYTLGPSQAIMVWLMEYDPATVWLWNDGPPALDVTTLA